MNPHRSPNLLCILLLAAFAALIVGCGGGGGGIDSGGGNYRPVELQSIQVQAARTSLEAGATVELHAIGHYSDGTVADVTSIVYPMASLTWDVSDSDVATVTGSTLRAQKAGSVIVTAKDTLSHVVGTASFTVTPAIPQSLRISGFDADKLSYSTRDRRKLNAEVIYSDGSTIPASTTTWSSSNPGVFSVDAQGNFQANATGSATLTATSGTFSATLQITIVAATTPRFVVSCDPRHPTTIAAQDWNDAFAQDPKNSTEWIVVDGVSCQAHQTVYLLIPVLGSVYHPFFIATRSAVDPTMFLAGVTVTTGNSPQLTAGNQIVVGSAADAMSFTTLYSVAVQ